MYMYIYVQNNNNNNEAFNIVDCLLRLTDE
jgi:hypothetical protein